MSSKYQINGQSLSDICDTMPSHVPDDWKGVFGTSHFNSTDTLHFTDTENTSEQFCLKDSFLLKDETYLTDWGSPGYVTQFEKDDTPIKLASKYSTIFPGSSSQYFFEWEPGYYFPSNGGYPNDRMYIKVVSSVLTVSVGSTTKYTSAINGKWIVIDCQGRGGPGGNGFHKDPLLSDTWQCGGGGGGSGAYCRFLINTEQCSCITFYINGAGNNLGFYDSVDVASGTQVASISVEDGKYGGDGSTATNSGHRGNSGAVINNKAGYSGQALKQDTTSFGDRVHCVGTGVYVLSCVWGVEGTGGVVVRSKSASNSSAPSTSKLEFKRFFSYDTYETIVREAGHSEVHFTKSEGCAGGGGGAPSASANGRSHPNSGYAHLNGTYGCGGYGSSAWVGANSEDMIGQSGGNGYLAIYHN